MTIRVIQTFMYRLHVKRSGLRFSRFGQMDDGGLGCDSEIKAIQIPGKGMSPMLARFRYISLLPAAGYTHVSWSVGLLITGAGFVKLRWQRYDT